jgi:hypothetical protein
MAKTPFKILDTVQYIGKSPGLTHGKFYKLQMYIDHGGSENGRTSYVFKDDNRECVSIWQDEIGETTSRYEMVDEDSLAGLFSKITLDINDFKRNS